MKRFIPCLCVILAFVCAFSFPAQAADISNDVSFDVLHYSMPNNGTSLAVGGVKSGQVISFDVPKSTYYYVDMVIRSNAKDLSVACNSYDLSVMLVSYNQANIYRIYGSIGSQAVAKLNFKFTFSAGSLITFESLNVDTLRYSRIDVSCTFDTLTPALPNGGSVDHSAGGITSTQSIPANPNYENNYFTTFIYSDEWKKYDFLDFTFLFDVTFINSFSAHLGDQPIPISCTDIHNSNFDGQYIVTMRMDLRGLHRDISDYPQIIVTGSGKVNSSWSISCLGSSGFILSDIDDSTSFNLMRIWNSIKSGFSDLLKALASHAQNINNNLGNLDNHFLEFASKVKTWISDQTDSIISSISDLKSNIQTWIKEQTDSLVSAIKGDSSAGDQFQGEVGEKTDQITDMIGAIDSVDRPDLGSIDFEESLDTQFLTTTMSGLSNVMRNPIIFEMLTLSLILASAGYALFGKR